MSPRIRSLRVSSLLLAISLATSLVAGATIVSADTPAIQVSSVTLSPDDPVEDETVTFETTIANLQQNSDTVQVTDVYLRRSGSTTEYARIENVGSVAPGGTLTVPLTASFGNAGKKDLTVYVVVQQNESFYSYSYPATVDVEAPVVRGGLSAARGSGETSVTVANYGNVNFTDVEISSVVGGEVDDQRLTGDIDPDRNRTVTFDTANYDSDNVTFRATYTANGTSHELSRTVDLDQQVTGEIRLTSVDIKQSGRTVSVESDAANVGGTDVTSVLVSVRDTDDVTPGSGSGEYFIGPVDASEFATFELSADVEPGVSSVPIEIAYIVDNERVTTTQQLDLDSAVSNASQSGSDGDTQPADRGGPLGAVPLVGLGIALAVLVVVGFGVVRWRNQ